jgi:hypothetical protein
MEAALSGESWREEIVRRTKGENNRRHGEEKAKYLGAV